MAADWNAIKTEYITTDTSYRKLSQKYGIHHNLIYNRSKQEGWIEQRERHRDKTVTKAINKVSDKQADRTARLIHVSDLLLGRVEKLLEDEEEPYISVQSMKYISGILKDVKDVQMIKSDADLREQEARIANLRKMAEKNEDKNAAIEIVFEAGPEEWNG